MKQNGAGGLVSVGLGGVILAMKVASVGTPLL